MPIILIDENIPLLKECLSDTLEIKTFSGRKLDIKNKEYEGLEYLFIRSTLKIDSEFLYGTKIRFVGSATSGIDHIDLNAIEKYGVYFCYAPGSNANSVAEYVIYAILKWAEITGNTIDDCSIGIIGFGNIGKLVAKYAQWMGLKVIVNDPPLLANEYCFPVDVEYSDLDYIFKTCNIITNHVPLTETGQFPTKSLISLNQLKNLQPFSLFIHTSRGGVVREQDLLNYSKKNKLFLAIDVWINEPFIDERLAKSAFLATPHIAGYSWEGKLRGTLALANEFKKFSGLNPKIDIILNEFKNYTPLNKNEYKNYKYLYDTLKRKRQLDEDTKMLLKIFQYDFNTRGKLFDQLRKNYPKRRETL